MENEMIDEKIGFAEEDSEKRPFAPAWKILIADDQPEIHQVTKLALSQMTFQGRPVRFLSAYSAAEAEKILVENPDTALALIDVVMENRTSGLELVKTIREKLENHLIRLVLRTGLPDAAPEREIIEKYDINDYRSKTELTATRLFSIVLSSLRTFSLLFNLEFQSLEYRHLNENLEKIVHEKTEELRRKEQLLQSIMDASLTPTVVIRVCGGEVVFVNRKGAETYGEPFEKVLGRRDYIDFPDQKDRERIFSEVMLNGQVKDIEVKARVRNGEPFWALFSGVRMQYGDEPCLLFDFVDVSKRKALEERLRNAAAADPLTGAMNKAALAEFSEREVARAQRKKTPFGILMFDPDKLSDINGAYGREAGDAVLKSFAALCRRSLRPTDGFARIGGEEFVALLPETDRVSLLAAAERLRMACERSSVFFGDQELRVTVSIGAAVYEPEKPLPVDDLIKRAENAVMKSKAGGGNRVTVSLPINV